MSLRWTAPTGPGDTSTELPPLGAMVDDGDGDVHGLGAVGAQLVDVMTDDAVVPMVPGPHGTFRATVAGGHGDRYRFRIDGAAILPDPMSRAQPEGVRGPSAVVDPSTFTWTDGSWTGVALDELVLYELHVGTFTAGRHLRRGTRPRLDELRDLGVTAIELMPVANVPRAPRVGLRRPLHVGTTSRVRRSRGARRASSTRPTPPGSGVVLDVVYNHLGPGAEAITAFGPYTDPERSTFWGPAIAFQHRGVREWAIQNAEALGARLPRRRPPARRGARHLRRVHAAHRRRARGPGSVPVAHDVGHRGDGDRRRATDPTSGGATRNGVTSCTTRCTCCSRASTTATTPTTGAWPTSPASTNGPMRHGSSCARRTTTRWATVRSATACAAASCAWPRSARSSHRGCRSCSWGRSTTSGNPFLFFADHIDPEIARATREGRRREFERFTAFADGDVPDPGAMDTFVRSHLRSRGRRPRAPGVLPRAARAAPHPPAGPGRDDRRRGSPLPAGAARRRRAAHELLARRARGRPAVVGSGPMTDAVAGLAVPAGCAVGRQRHQLRPVLRERGVGRALPLRRRRPRDPHRGAGADRAPLALLPAGSGPGPAVRVPGVRALRPCCRSSLQPDASS